MTAVGSDALLRGALYALGQSGLLLRDAVVLYDAHRYASAVGLALLAREELGRHRLLVDLWRKAVADPAFSITEKSLKDATDDHVRKQERSQLSIVLHGNYGTQVGKLMKAQSENPPGSEAHRAASEALDTITERRKKRQPHERHEQRMGMFYVDFVGGEWSRPSDAARELGAVGCYNEVNNAINDYAGVRNHLQDRVDQSLKIAIDGLGEIPSVPDPRWPSDSSFAEALHRERAGR